MLVELDCLWRANVKHKVLTESDLETKKLDETYPRTYYIFMKEYYSLLRATKFSHVMYNTQSCIAVKSSGWSPSMRLDRELAPQTPRLLISEAQSYKKPKYRWVFIFYGIYYSAGLIGSKNVSMIFIKNADTYKIQSVNSSFRGESITWI